MSNAERVLEVAIPPVKMTAKQAKAFQDATEYAASKNIKVITKMIS